LATGAWWGKGKTSTRNADTFQPDGEYDVNYKITLLNESFIERMGADVANTWYDGHFGVETRATEDWPEAFVYDEEQDSYLVAIPINSFLVESYGEYLFRLNGTVVIVSLRDSENLRDAEIRGKDNKPINVDAVFLKRLADAFAMHGRYIVRIDDALRVSGKVKVLGPKDQI
jgi:hypothetical protein